MSNKPRLLRAVYVDGETKTGKGAASQAISAALTAQGFNVYYDIAGDFFRRLVALVRLQLDLDEGESLPTGPYLERVTEAIYKSGRAIEKDASLGNLQRSAISRSVSVLAELHVAQQAGLEWYGRSLQQAAVTGADVVVLDGRNPRSRVKEGLTEHSPQVQTALDLYMTCAPQEAARRTLHGRGIADPSGPQIEQEVRHVMDRRTRDRQRSNRPFLSPEVSVRYDPSSMTPIEAVQKSWDIYENAIRPIAITIDNTNFEMSAMLEAVSALGVESVRYSLGKPDAE